MPQDSLTSSRIGALFDWDGVVVDSSAQHERSWELLADENGKRLPPDHFLRGFGMKNQEIIRDLLEWCDDPREIEALSLRKEVLYRQVVQEEGIAPIPGAVELLHLLNERGVECAVASSTHRENITSALERIGISHLFAAVVSAEDVTVGKPDPEVFVKCAKAIGREQHRCVVFEDAVVGIQAGQAAGMKVVAVATTNSLDKLLDANLAVETLEHIDWPTLELLFSR